MSFIELINTFKDLAKEYYPLLVFLSAIVSMFGVIFGVGPKRLTLIWKKVRSFLHSDVSDLKERNNELEQKLNRVRGAFDQNNNPWLRQPIIKPSFYDLKMQDSIPIILVANLKGGVGKTTISANLTAFFEHEKNERVLAIDIDHQGSLSSMLLPSSEGRGGQSADLIMGLLGGSNTADAIGFKSRLISAKGSRLIDCDDPFADFETKIQLQWLIGDTKEDIRYNLARVLHSEEVQKHFDRVIIDASPRITTGFINALCASSHILVPFVLDRLSAERVGQSLGRIRRLRGHLFPHLELAYVVGTMKADSTDKWKETELEALAEAKRAVCSSWGPGDYVLDRIFIPRKQVIADYAGISVVYPIAKSIFDPLGNKLYEKIPSRKPVLKYNPHHRVTCHAEQVVHHSATIL